jgi:hypothetical protein
MLPFSKYMIERFKMSIIFSIIIIFGYIIYDAIK